VSCGSPHKTAKTSRHLSAAQKAKLSAALKGKSHPGRKMTLEQRRKLSEALKCYYAMHGTCKHPKPQTAHQIEKSLLKKLHQHPAGAKKCPAGMTHRHGHVTPRRLAHQRRTVMRHVRAGHRQHRIQRMPRWRHLVDTLPAKRGRRLLRLEREWRKRSRKLHGARLQCHIAHRHAGPKIRQRRQCPKPRKSRLLKG
jgi:NUMOD3 motif